MINRRISAEVCPTSVSLIPLLLDSLSPQEQVDFGAGFGFRFGFGTLRGREREKSNDSAAMILGKAKGEISSIRVADEVQK